MIIDARFKDAAPEKTVDKIQGILVQNDIQVVENWYESGVKNCYSLRVSVKDSQFGANGKGVTREFARASAYAELMERMQAGYLTRRQCRDNHLEYRDAVTMDRAEFRAACGRWCEELRRGISGLFHLELSASAVEDKCFEAEAGDGTTIRVLPFYDVTAGKMTYFPQRIVTALYNTNGLAAGNTLEEAVSQSFSEIFERANLVKFFFGDITPPQIPEEYLRKCEKSYEAIEDLRRCGLDVQIRDCSLGEPFPLIAAVVIDRRHNAYHVHMGAHPVFEIALERSLTEMFQGRTLITAMNTTEFTLSNSGKRSFPELLDFLTLGCGKYALSFFGKTPSYPFRPFPDRTGMTNRALLTEITDYVRAKGYHMLVRSVSHLGFPSVRLLIPGMSEALPNRMLSVLPQLYLLQRYRDAAIRTESLSEAEQMEYRAFLYSEIQQSGAEAISFRVISGKDIAGSGTKSDVFLAKMLICYLDWLPNRAAALKTANSSARMGSDEENSYLSCLCCTEACLAAGRELDAVLSDLSVFYPDEVIAAIKKAYETGSNPFARFLVRCTPERCSSCAYAGTCRVPETRKLIDKVRGAAEQFDNEEAFRGIAALFDGCLQPC
jgi:ribosomal protein S12 methylthiotransferase accessory factor